MRLISILRKGLLLACFSPIVTLLAASPPADLQVNYETTPLGTDAADIYFSWRMEAGEDAPNGLRQTAWQIKVTDEVGHQTWSSGIVISGSSLGIRYEGEALQPTTRYTWTVTTWDNLGDSASESSWFETGLMNPDISAWNGATWIGGREEDMVLQAQYLSVFRLEYTLQLDQASKSVTAAFVYGGNDQRLMDPNLNLLGMANHPDESYIALELNIRGLQQEGGSAVLNVYRAGYAPEDRERVPFEKLTIPTTIINASNQYEPHRFFIASMFGTTDIFVDAMDSDHQITPAGGGFAQPGGLNLNPYGRGGDYIAFPMVGDIGFRMDNGQRATFSDVAIRNYRAPSNAVFSEDLAGGIYAGIFSGKSAVAVENGGYQVSGGGSGTLTLADPSRNAAPMLRTTFSTASKRILKARIYATARGIYELYLNGQRVGDDYFNPGLTQYNKHHLYQTYDVTELVQAGEPNALGAWLSEGWWSGAITFSGQNWNFFGDRQSLLAKLVITYEDGSEDIITSNPDTWSLFTDGPIRYGSFFQGEYYDARKEAGIAGWSEAGFDDIDWKTAVEVPLDGTTWQGTYRNFAGVPVTIDYANQQLIGQFGRNVSIVKTLTAQSVEEVRPGVFVYDMGQNMVGFPNLTIQNGIAGQSIRLRYAEVLYPELEEYGDNDGMVMLENIRGALTQDLYVLKGGDEVIQPRFTFHGYRFVEITGISQALPLEAVKGRVLSSVDDLSSHYETSNALINRLWKNITWSFRANFLSIPTDTPARNERMGWNGDINVFVETATWLGDVNQFLKRHMLAMRDMQAENGRFSDVAPVGNGFGGTLWGSAGIVVAWEAYQQWGDVSLLAEHYQAMKAYAEYLESRLNEDGILVEGPLGDWLSPENGKNDNAMLWMAYFLYDLDILRQVATVLEKPGNAIEFAEKYARYHEFFNQTWFNESGQSVKSGAVIPAFGPPTGGPEEKGKPMDTQASYAVALALGVVDEDLKEQVVENFAHTIARPNTDDGGVERPAYSLMTGFIGSASIGSALAENGLHDLAYRLVQTETYPSWLYPVKNGATTIWERLNSYTHDNGFGGNNSMNSFNHYSFGAIAAWMYNHSLGIQRNPEDPGFHTFTLAPTPDPDGQMTFAKGWYDSMYGRIVSEWYLEEGGTRYVFVIPPNTTATVQLLGEGSWEGEEGIRYKGMEDGRAVYEAGSGSYEVWVKD